MTPGATTPEGIADPDHRLDLRGLHCPMPVLRLRKAMRRMTVGEAIVIECTDPLSVIDIPHFVAAAGHDLTAMTQERNLYVYRIVRRR